MKAALVFLAAAIGAVCTAGPYTSGSGYKNPPPPPYAESTYTTTAYPKDSKPTYDYTMKTPYQDTYNNPPASYDYEYRVFDAYPPSGSSDYGYGGSSYSNIPLDFGAQESRKGDHTKGSYDVLLPDGQRQTVTYYVDGKSGYVADVKYTQEVNPEPYNPPKQGSYAMPGSNYASGPYVEPSMMTAYSDTPYTSNPYTTAYSSNPYTTAYNSKAYSTYSSAPYTASYGHNPYMME